MCSHTWPPDIVVELVSDTNPEGKIKNSDLDITALVLHEVTLLEAVPKAIMAVPCSGYDNNPNVY